MRYCELRQKDVINRCNCKRLGRVCDLIFDECTGFICSIIIPGPARLCGLVGPDQEYVIPWNKICKIGPDIILVEVCEQEVLCPRKNHLHFLLSLFYFSQILPFIFSIPPA